MKHSSMHRGKQGAAGGVVRWIRVINDTAVAVDQLGMRAGAVAVYLDAWHRDLQIGRASCRERVSSPV